MHETIVQRLRDEAAKCEYRANQTEVNAKKAEDLSKRMCSLEDTIAKCTNVIDHLTPMLNDIQTFINERAKLGQMRINQALAVAGDIIPDSMKGVQFKTEGEKSWLEVNGMNADDIEGSGYKGASSMFIQASILKQNPQYLQTLILDEPLAKVSVENSAAISKCLPFMCEDMQVILIEQKTEVYADFPYTNFTFFKDENGTRVDIEEIKFEEEEEVE